MKNKLLTILLLGLILCCITTSFSSIVFAESTSESEDSFINDSSVVHTDEFDYGWKNLLRWYSQPLWYCEKNTYYPTSHDYKYCKYHTSVISNLPYYKVMGTDNGGQGQTIELSQVDSIDSAQNHNTLTSVVVSFQGNNVSYGSGVYLNHDDYILGALTSDLQIFGSLERVGNGKVFYRTAAVPDGSPWGSWSYTDLGVNTTISFSANRAVQIVVIYEVKEEKLNWTQSHQYYRCLGYYRFNTGV